MKIAFPTDDRKTIAERTGRCKEFAIVELKTNNVTYNYLPNTHKHEHNNNGKKEHEHSHNEIIQLLEGIDLLIVRRIGKYMKLDIDKSKIKYKQVEKTEIEDIVEEYKKNI